VKVEMNCKFRACKFNQQEVCGKYKTVEEMVKDFENGGGCAFTWFFTGQIPKQAKEEK
jgi:hypothetical protein